MRVASMYFFYTWYTNSYISMHDIKFISKTIQPKQMINRDVTLGCKHFFFIYMYYHTFTAHYFYLPKDIDISLFILLKIFVYRNLCHKNDLDIMENNDSMSWFFFLLRKKIKIINTISLQMMTWFSLREFMTYHFWNNNFKIKFDIWLF